MLSTAISNAFLTQNVQQLWWFVCVHRGEGRVVHSVLVVGHPFLEALTLELVVKIVLVCVVGDADSSNGSAAT